MLAAVHGAGDEIQGPAVMVAYLARFLAALPVIRQLAVFVDKLLAHEPTLLIPRMTDALVAKQGFVAAGFAMLAGAKIFVEPGYLTACRCQCGFKLPVGDAMGQPAVHGELVVHDLAADTLDDAADFLAVGVHAA